MNKGWTDGWMREGGSDREKHREKKRGMRMKCEFGSVRAAV